MRIIPDKSHESRVEFGLDLSQQFRGANNLVVDAHGYGKRFIVCADEILTAFLELERAIHEFAVSLIS